MLIVEKEIDYKTIFRGSTASDSDVSHHTTAGMLKFSEHSFTFLLDESTWFSRKSQQVFKSNGSADLQMLEEACAGLPFKVKVIISHVGSYAGENCTV